MKTREQCLRELRERLERANVFYEDVWDRILKLDTAILNEIVESNFEEQLRNAGS